MKVLALVYPGMTLLDLVGPLQAGVPCPATKFSMPGTVRCSAHGLRPQRAGDQQFRGCWTDPDVLVVGGGAKPTLDLLGDSAAIAFLADRGSRARWVCSVCTGSLLLGAAGLLRGYRAAVHWGAREALNQFGASPAASTSASTAIGSPVAASRGCRLRYPWRGLGWREHGASHRTDYGVRATAAVWDGPS